MQAWNLRVNPIFIGETQHSNKELIMFNHLESLNSPHFFENWCTSVGFHLALQRNSTTVAQQFLPAPPVVKERAATGNRRNRRAQSNPSRH